MQINVVAKSACGDNRVLLVLCPQARKAFVRLGVDDSSLFDPADFVFFGLHPEEAASVLEDFERWMIEERGLSTVGIAQGEQLLHDGLLMRGAFVDVP